MFYPINLLCGKRGRLAIVWVAGTVGFNQSTYSFLNKRELLSVNIQKACNEVVAPHQPMALRLAAILMLGITRIYKRQTKFLLVDIEDMYKDLKKHHSFSIDLIDATNSKGANLVLTNCVGEVETFETDRLLIGLLSNLHLISDSSYTAYENTPVESFTSIVMQSNSDESITNLATVRAITLDTNNLTLDRMQNDDLGGPMSLSLADDSFGQVRESFNSDIEMNGNISPLHYTTTSPVVTSNKNLLRQAFNQCSLQAIDEEMERPRKRQKKDTKLAVDFTTCMSNADLRKNLDSQVDIVKVRKTVWPKKQLRYQSHETDIYLVTNRHLTRLYRNPDWSELENLIMPIFRRDETVSSTNFSRLLDSSSIHTASILRNASNVSVVGLQPNYSLDNLDINPMQIDGDVSLLPDGTIPCPSPPIAEIDNYESFQLMNGSDSFDRITTCSLRTEQILETFNHLKQTATRPFIFLKDLFPTPRPPRKEVAKIFYGVLKHACMFRPEQREPYGEILLPCDSET